MTKNPVTLPKTELAASALRLMEEQKITSVMVVDAEGKLEGVLHVHDLWTMQIVLAEKSHGRDSTYMAFEEIKFPASGAAEGEADKVFC